MRNLLISMSGSALGFFLAFSLGKSTQITFGSFQADMELVLGLFGLLAGYILSSTFAILSTADTNTKEAK